MTAIRAVVKDIDEDGLGAWFWVEDVWVCSWESMVSNWGSVGGGAIL